MNSESEREKNSGALRASVLIVDDTPESLTLLSELLRPLYQVRVANSGERALAVAACQPPPDLILLDVMMPGIDGFEVLRRLRADDATRDIPVIFVTARDDEADELRGFELGAADFIRKPILATIVLSRVRAQLDARAARALLKNNNRRLVSQVAEGVHSLEQAQLQLLQSEKMAAMGQLAAGVAHEINNPIGFVGSNLGTLGRYLEHIFAIVAAYEKAAAATGNDEAFAEAREIRRSSNYDFLRQDIVDLIAESKDGIARVSLIVRDLKDFSRAGDTDWQWADLHQGIDSTLNMVWNELKYHCKVTKDYGTLPQIHCLPAQLNQVFMNLLVNAGQAIETRGEITIATERVGSNAVRIVIRDTGKGIAAQDLSQIFEPFFTTKPVGKGTGLGLSLVWSIVERHHGRIEVASEVGHGTTFTVTLPLDAEVLSRAGSGVRDLGMSRADSGTGR
ncbi:MAG: response regulator [Sulfuritalea sp.]|nr:response regulator [Sulfuritalea sp.]